ncbi:hypothetical protein HWI79_1789 [Cryptosporidium felis]|nr:hypothetical protein HWI79_1789 [Cryptosporidium felis]
MELNLKYDKSNLSPIVYPHVEFDRYIATQEKYVPNSCSLQHYCFENIGPKQLVSQESPTINDNVIFDPTSQSNTCLDPRESGSFSAIRRSSLRGRRRYRRTLLRSCEQPISQNVQGENSHMDINEGTENHFQRRAFLRNQSVGTIGLGIGGSTFKINNNYDGYSKAAKPSWDGGRLVKLLQGHGLNIDNCDGDSPTIRSWNSKQSSIPNKQAEYSGEYKESSVLNENEQNYLKIDYMDNKGNGIFSANFEYQKVTELDQAKNFSLNPNEQSGQFISLHKASQSLMEGNEANNYSNNQEKHFENFTVFNEIECSENNKLNFPNAEQVRNTQKVDKKYLINIEQITSESKFLIQEELGINKDREDRVGGNPTGTAVISGIERQNLNVNNQVINCLEDLGDNSVSQSISLNLNNPHYSTSHEELFVTLGDTPTSKSNYNLSNLFVPNQES